MINYYSKILSHLTNRLPDNYKDFFIYFDYEYKFEVYRDFEPEFVLCVKTKYREQYLLTYTIDYNGNEYFECDFCSSDEGCSHLAIVINDLLGKHEEELRLTSEKYSAIANNHFKLQEQKEFDLSIDEIIRKQRLEDSSNSQSKATIEVCLEKSFSDFYNLSYKIGKNKFYKIPSIDKFLNRIRLKEIFRYGKDLEVIHTLSSFDDKSKKLIEYLLTNYNETYHYSERDLNELIDNILDIYKGNTVTYLDEPIYISEKCADLSFDINEEFNLKPKGINSKNIFIGRKYFFDSEKRTIYSISNDDTIVDLYYEVLEHPLADIKNKMTEFKYAFINRFPNYFNISEPVMDQMSKDKDLSISAYFDYENGCLTANIKLFKNGEEISINNIASIFEQDYLNNFNRILETYGFVDYKIDSKGNIFNFLNGTLDDLRKIANVYFSDGLANKKTTSFASPQIRGNKEGSMFDVFLSESQYSDEELYEIYSAIKKKKKFILINDNFINLDTKESIQFADNLDEFNFVKDKKILRQARLPLYYAFKAFGASDNTIQMDDYVNEAFENVKNFSTDNINLPQINGELRKYQVEGVKWLNILYKYNLGGILADDMGLGKTIETISFIKTENPKAPVLIVCPKSLIFNWINEFARFSDDIKTIAINGSISERKAIIDAIDSKKLVVYLISYDSLRNEINNLKNIQFDTCILDEAQFIKNSLAKKTNAVKEIKANHRFALTGTPIENEIYDLWSIFDFLMPDYLFQLKTFTDKYEASEDYKDIVKLKVSPFILRRRKDDVLKNLPDKYEVIYSAEMVPEQRKIYDAYVKQANEAIKNAKSGDMFKVLSFLTRLRQICVHPGLFIDNYQSTSGKISSLEEIIDNKIKDGHRMLIFSQFVSALEIIEKILTNKNISYYSITGDTSAKKRIEIADSFNNDSKYKVVLISLKAGGTGLNLVGADTVIHLDPWWNVSATNQATDRAHRIGQKRAVEVIKMICENTIEEKVIELQNKKKELIDRIIANDDTSIKNLSIDDLKEILSV